MKVEGDLGGPGCLPFGAQHKAKGAAATYLGSMEATRHGAAS